METTGKKQKLSTKGATDTQTEPKIIDAKSGEFDEDLFETRLESLKDTQDGVQAMSFWCLDHRAHHKKIVSCWLNVFKRVRVEHRLTLFYLANDVIQYSKRKRYEFVEAWATALQRATTMVRDAKVKGKILRIFQIWEQRDIYNEEFLTDLSGLLNISPTKRTDAPTEPGENEFQSTKLIQSIRECIDLAECTDRTFKKLPKAPNTDIEEIKQQLKDKIHQHNICGDIDRYVTYIEAFQKILSDEIKSRKHVITNLNKALKFYTQQRSDVKVVVTAYKNFGNRIKLVKKKVDEMQPELPSPIPSPDINAPSPERDAELKLPDEEPSPPNISLLNNTAINGFASYIGENLPFNLSDFKNATKTTSQPIEVIGSRSDDESYTSTGSADVGSLNANFYKPGTIGLGLGGYGSEVNIPGLNPLPVPPVAQSEYTSLARAAQQYTGNDTSDYLSSYSNDAGYGMDMYGHNNSSDERVNSSSVNSNGAESGEYTPVWDMPNISAWNTTASGSNNTFAPASSMDTPVSPQNFKGGHEFAEHNSSSSSTGGTHDVDHQQLNLAVEFLTANNSSNKLGLSKEKARQLDIDHRNLISLTGSPIINELDKKTHWPMTTNSETSYLTNCEENSDFHLDKSKTNTRALENGGNIEKNTVVDMDMSDEDMETIYQELNGTQTAREDNSQLNTSLPVNNPWDPNRKSNSNQSFPPPPPPPPPPLPAVIDPVHNNWPVPWNSGMGQVGVPSPPRPPAPFPGMPYNGMNVGAGGNFAPTGFNRPTNMNDIRGRGRGSWRDGPQNQYRNFSPRPPIMRNNPYFVHGNPNSPSRGRGNPFRGKFRGNSSWI